jgi:hypothetical protein
MELFAATHPVQIKESLANDCILVENLVKLAKLEEEYFFVIVNFKLPVLSHARGEFLPCLLRDVKRAGIILRVIWSVAIFVLQILFFKKIG